MSYDSGIGHRRHMGRGMGIGMVSVASDMAFGFVHVIHRQ